jgi:hypothetical protein
LQIIVLTRATSRSSKALLMALPYTGLKDRLAA